MALGSPSGGFSAMASDLGIGGLGDQLASDLSEDEKKRRKQMQDQQGGMNPSAMSLLGAFGTGSMGGGSGLSGR